MARKPSKQAQLEATERLLERQGVLRKRPKKSAPTPALPEEQVKHLTEQQLDDELGGALHEFWNGLTSQATINRIRKAYRDAGYRSPSKVQEAERAAVERVELITLESIAAEPEYPSAMPDELWEQLDGNRRNTEKAMRSTVRLTKNNITDRFMEALKSELLGEQGKAEISPTHQELKSDGSTG